MSADADAALEYLRSLGTVDDTEIISGPGFCFGGTQSLVFASRHQTAATITCYGTYISELADSTGVSWGKIGAQGSPVLGIYGELDARPSPAQAEAFRAALTARGVAHNVSIYPEVGHAFITPDAHRHAEHVGHAQAVAAWEQIVRFVDGVHSGSGALASAARRARSLDAPPDGPHAAHTHPAQSSDQHAEDKSLYHRAICAFKCALDVLKGSGHWQHGGLPTFMLERLLAIV